MISGVQVRQLKLNLDERGWLVEVLRSDWDIFDKFAQVYVTTAYPQVVKAWHMHRKQTDNITCVHGTIKLVLYDGRGSSKTKGKIDQFVIGEQNLLLVKIPPGVWHGFKNVGDKLAIVINLPTELYDYKQPDEHRLPPDSKEIPYDWKLAPWLKHG